MKSRWWALPILGVCLLGFLALGPSLVSFHREVCPNCGRAKVTRYIIGVPAEREQDTALTAWYRRRINVDHDHDWGHYHADYDERYLAMVLCSLESTQDDIALYRELHSESPERRRAAEKAVMGFPVSQNTESIRNWWRKAAAYIEDKDARETPFDT